MDPSPKGFATGRRMSEAMTAYCRTAEIEEHKLVMLTTCKVRNLEEQLDIESNTNLCFQ